MSLHNYLTAISVWSCASKVFATGVELHNKGGGVDIHERTTVCPWSGAASKVLAVKVELVIKCFATASFVNDIFDAPMKRPPCTLSQQTE
jgi:hypothetical protein